MTVTTTEQALSTRDRVEVGGGPCIRCNGTGTEVRQAIPAEWEDVFTRLRAVGRRRAEYSTARSSGGKAMLYATWVEIADIDETDGRRVGMSTIAAADAVGISRAQLDTILKRAPQLRAEAAGRPVPASS